ncbi:uncharacterized protein LDX57_006864 [Aspergillus melleus]|uniref:uncharacterized protein n=1 Tax=Aspergillus melleus TaxID=138277 RepID=UPI001E8CFA5F|nr:uncharacterized protein LDX57_006864 [Aspergillus melleus]KAH8429195.1 hypothetical protein LDX57_006864 [Aspergillus melleus]
MSKKEKTDLDPEAIAPAQFPGDPVLAEKAIEHDAVFGEITESGPNYRNVRVL